MAFQQDTSGQARPFLARPEGSGVQTRTALYEMVEATFVQPFTSLRKWGLACNILLASRVFFISGERSERERKICLDTGQLSMPRRNVITVFNSYR